MPPTTRSPRRSTRQIHVGSVAVGGDAPVSVQSMTTTKTADVDATLAQIYSLAAAGCDIVRCTCNEEPAAEGLAQIVPRSPVPIVADIHFQYKLALAAMEAGVQGLRLNPGNIRKPEHIRVVAQEAKDRGIPVRIGVNAGSLDPDIAERFGGATPEALVASAQRELAYFAEIDFHDVKISVKSSNVPVMIDAYRLLSETIDHPLHLGVTEAGPLPGGLVKSTAGIATLLAEGIGDTIRFSLTADPVEEAKAGRQLLEAMGLRERKGLDLIACPSCGRAEVDVIRVAREAQDALEQRNIPLQVAVMGCVVNGPGEARDADLGIAAGRGKGHLFVRGQVVRVVPEAEMVDALVREAELIVAEGIDARLAAADADAEAIAAATRSELLQIQGVDVNHSGERIDRIRDIAEESGFGTGYRRWQQRRGPAVCFSAEADFASGAVIGVIGVATLTKVARPREIPLAALPLAFALHQAVEGFVWRDLDDGSARATGVAVLLYVVFAWIVLPVLVPLSIMLLEPAGRARRRIGALVVVGAVASAILAASVVSGSVSARAVEHTLQYGGAGRWAWFATILYVIATCGAPLLSGFRAIAWFGVANVVAVAAIVLVQTEGLTSVWCLWAAVVSVLIFVQFTWWRQEDTPATRTVEPAPL